MADEDERKQYEQNNDDVNILAIDLLDNHINELSAEEVYQLDESLDGYLDDARFEQYAKAGA